MNINSENKTIDIKFKHTALDCLGRDVQGGINYPFTLVNGANLNKII